MLFKVYRSSAGSGKTFTLVKEYLKLCLRTPESDLAFRNILALTFTNKATAEMKTRILSGLEGLSNNPWPKSAMAMGEVLSQELNISAEDLQQRCRAVFRSLLHRYEDFAVLTIDKFTGKVIRSFANDLGLNQDFEIELDGEKVLRQAISNILDRLGNDAALTMALTEFAVSKAEEDGSHRISEDVFNFSRNLLKEENSLRLDYYRNFSIADLMEIKANLTDVVRKNEGIGKEIATKVLQLLQANGIPLDAFSYGLKGGFGVYWKNILDNNGVLKPGAHPLKAIETQKFTPAKGSDYKDGIEAIAPQLTEAFNQYQSFLETHFSTTTIYRNALKNFSSLVVMNEVEKELLALKEQLNIVLITDFNLKISQIVSTEPAPFIYEKLGQRYYNYLIDEFQDTSVMQWLNLLPLVDEALATGHFSLLVGDSKQSIYRFRGGEVAQFAMLPKIYVSEGLQAQQMEVGERERFNNLRTIREQRLADSFVLNSLTVNRRSKAEIVQFNNSLFSKLHSLLSERNREIFSDFIQEENPDNRGGFVQIQLVNEKESELNYSEINIEFTLQTIQSCLADGYQPGDIAVLCRAKKNGAEVAEELLKQGYNVVSADSMLVAASPNVRLLIAVAKSLSDKASLISMATVARHLATIWERDIDELMEIARKDGLEGLIAITGKVVSLDYLSGLPLYDLFLESASLFLKTIDTNTQFLFDEALIYSQRYGDHLPGFLEYFEDNSGNLKIRATDSRHAITVMTIHKSKGLEFPVVIMPFADDKLNTKGNTVWYDNPSGNPPTLLLSMNKELLETDAAANFSLEKDKMILDLSNLLYVSTTRPRERLYIFSKELIPKEETDMSVSSLLTAFCNDNQTQKVDERIYEWGTRTPKPASSEVEKVIDPSAISPFSPPSSWRKNLIVKAESSTTELSSDREKAQHFGNLLHKAISLVKSSEDDLAAILTLMSKTDTIEEEHRTELEKQLRSILFNPSLAEYFSQDWVTMNELEIILPEGKVLRPDRVLLQDNRAIVIDFKTGLRSPKHLSQIAAYSQTLKLMGYEVEKAVIYYTESGEVVG